jgi:hypothetical protein
MLSHLFEKSEDNRQEKTESLCQPEHCGIFTGEQSVKMMRIGSLHFISGNKKFVEVEIEVNQ